MNPFYRTDPAAASEVLCKGFVDIICENTHTRRPCVVAAYLFFN